MLATLISSKTRIKLLLKFFLNTTNSGYLRGLESEFGESSNAIRLELNKFEQSGLLVSFAKGNRKYFQANTSHPLFHDIHNIVKKHIGFDQIIINILAKLGDLKQVYVLGAFAKGLDSQVIDLLLIGDINKSYFIELTEKVEKLIDRRIRHIIYTDNLQIDWSHFTQKPLLLWEES